MKQKFLLIVLLFSSQLSQATHILGGEIQVIPQPLNNFEFQLTLYRDPSGIALPNTTVAEIRKQGNLQKTTTLSLDTTFFIFPNCNDTIEIGKYSSIENIIYPYGLFTVEWESCCRPPNISNLISPETQGTYLIAHFNVPSNFNLGTVKFNPISQFSFPKDSLIEIDLSAHSVGRDSLFYDLRPLRGTNGVNCNYDSTYSRTNPFGDSIVTSLNPETGLLTVLDPLIGTYGVGIRVYAYRNGQLVGTIHRDIPIQITTPNANQPQIQIGLQNLSLQAGKAYPFPGGIFLDVKENSKVSFDINATTNFLVNQKPAIISLMGEGTGGKECASSFCFENENQPYATFQGNLKDSANVLGSFSGTIGNGFLRFSRPQGFAQYRFNATVEGSCGSVVSKTFMVLLRVEKSSIEIDTNYHEICQGDTIISTITGSNMNLVWTPNTWVTHLPNNQSYLYPQQTTDYTIWNLVDSSLTSLRVEVDSQYTGTQLLKNSDSIWLQQNINPFKSRWFFGLLEIARDQNSYPFYFDGKYWVDFNTSLCTSNTDTLIVDQPEVIHFLNRSSADINSYWPINQFEFQFEGLVSDPNSVLEIMIPFQMGYTNGASDWGYKITDLNTGLLVVEDTIVKESGHYFIRGLQLPLQNKKYEVQLTALDFQNGHIWPVINSTNNPVDEHNFIELSQPRARRIGKPYLTNSYPMVQFKLSSGLTISQNKLDEIKAYPNPFNEILNISVSGSFTYQITNSLGQLVISGEGKDDSTVDTCKLSKGMYVVQIKTEKGIKVMKLRK